MSSWFRKAAVGALFLLAVPAAWAQQRYFVPIFEVVGEHDTNRELRSSQNPEPVESSNIYRITAAARLGQNTQRGFIDLRPRLVYQEFPRCSCVNPLEEFLDLKSEYRTERATYSVDGRFSRQDTLNSELGQAEFDDDGDPTTPPVLIDTGLVFGGQTRTFYQLEPNFEYAVTERTNFDTMVHYSKVSYEDIPDSPRVGFDNPSVEFAVSHKFDERNRFDVGPYFSHFKAENDLRKTDSYGMRVGFHRYWTELSQLHLILRGERNETTVVGTLSDTKQSTTNWGLELQGERKNRVGSVRYSIGRYLQPSSLGSRRQADLFQLEYDRPLSERVLLTSAVRLIRDQRLGNADQEGDRKRARFELSLARMMTRTLQIEVGYRYGWQDLGVGADSADNHAALLTIRYTGLNPRLDKHQ